MNAPSLGAPIDDSELLSLEVLEPFGWIFTPGPLPPGSISGAAAATAAEVGPDSSPTAAISIASGTYTEKGRYRQLELERRVTLYAEHPVWVVSIEVPPRDLPSDELSSAERHSRHTVVDALSGRLITQFLQPQGTEQTGVLDLHAPLGPAELTPDTAVTAAIAGEERILTDLPRTAEYGSRWRLIPGFIQVTDVWRVSFDTSRLPPESPETAPEVAWVVMVDDKAGHRWLSAALAAPQPAESE